MFISIVVSILIIGAACAWLGYALGRERGFGEGQEAERRLFEHAARTAWAEGMLAIENRKLERELTEGT